MGLRGQSGTVQPQEPWALEIISGPSPSFLKVKTCAPQLCPPVFHRNHESPIQKRWRVTPPSLTPPVDTSFDDSILLVASLHAVSEKQYRY